MSWNDADSGNEGELTDRELPDRSDMDADVTDNSMPCPYCGRDIYEESEFCPRCGKYISREDAPLRLPVWLIIGVILAMMVVIFCWVL